MTEMRELRIQETTNVGLPSAYRYPRKALRVLFCLPSQNGWRSERGVTVVWESTHYNAGSRGPKSHYRKYRAEASALLQHCERCLRAGLRFQTPSGIVRDKLLEMGENI